MHQLLALGFATTATTKETTILGLDSQWFGVGVALITALIILAQLREGRKQRRLFELEVRGALAKRWVSVRPSWVMATLLTRSDGSDFYKLSDPTVESIYNAYIEDRDDWQRGRDAQRPVERLVRDLLSFFDDLARGMIENELEPSTVYEIVGNEVVRSTGVIRKLIGPWYGCALPTDSTDSVLDAYGRQRPMDEASWLSYHPALRTRMLIFVDLLWAEACRRGELTAMDVARVADLKRRQGTGHRGRQRLGASCRAGRPVRGWLASWPLRWLLTAADYPRRPGGMEEDQFADIAKENYPPLGMGVRRWFLRVRALFGRAEDVPGLPADGVWNL